MIIKNVACDWWLYTIWSCLFHFCSTIFRSFAFYFYYSQQRWKIFSTCDRMKWVMPLTVTLLMQFLQHYYGFPSCFSLDWESSEYIFIYSLFIFLDSKYRRKVGWGRKYLCHPLTYAPLAMTGTPYWTEE